LIWLYLLLLVVPLGAVGYIVWDFRRRTALRDAARAGRLEALIGSAAVVADAAPATTKEQVGSARLESPVSARERLLTPAQTLVYYLLKTALPQHLVFARVPLSFVLEPRRASSQSEVARMLAERTLDFVIADRSMRPLSIVTLRETARKDTQSIGAEEAAWITQSGMRHVALDTAALPRKEAIPRLVLPS
jgi:hypothetical protein